jgi:hypothetical protein
MTSRKKPGVAFWATVGLVVVLAAYPVSWGPTSWLLYNVEMSDQAVELVGILFYPIVWIGESSAAAASVMEWYQSLWIDFSKPSANPRVWGQLLMGF